MLPYLLVSSYLNYRPDIIRLSFQGPSIPIIFLAVLWTFSSSVKACVWDNVRCSVWLVCCGEGGEKMHSVSTDRDSNKQEMCYPRWKECVIIIIIIFYFEIKIYLIREFQSWYINLLHPNPRGLHTADFSTRMYFLFCRHYSHLSFELIPMDWGQF